MKQPVKMRQNKKKLSKFKKQNNDPFRQIMFQIFFERAVPKFKILTETYANHTKKVFQDFSTKLTTKHDTELFKQKYMENKLAQNPRCEACGSQDNEDSKMYTCGNCRITKYCGQECQTEDWKKGHYKICFGGKRNKTNRAGKDKIE